MSRRRKSNLWQNIKPYQYAGEQHPRDIGIYKSLVTSPAWYELRASSQSLYIQFISKMNIGDDYIFFYREELKKRQINSNTYLRAIDDLINHGFIKIIGHMYMNKFKPTLCIAPSKEWRNWRIDMTVDEFVKRYVPSQNTRKGNQNYSIKPSTQNINV